MDPINDKVLFGVINFRGRQARFGIKQDDRRRHMYIIGKTGMGKSELQKNIAIQDIQAGRGIMVIDAHGELSDALLDYIPKERINDVLYINPSDIEFPVGFNIIEPVEADRRHLVADGVMSVFKKIWEDSWSARMEYILHNTILALLEVPGATLLGVNRIYGDKDYRRWVIEQVKDPVVKGFWVNEFAKYADKFATEATAAIQNKVGQFVSSMLIRNIIGQTESTFNFRELMDQQKIVLVNLSKGKVGEEASRLIGSLIITKLQLAAMSRVDLPEYRRKGFTLMVDEFQNFATASFASILSEARKYGLSLIVAHQYIAQMAEEVRDAVFGNVGTLVSFRVGAEDAEALEKEFAPEFTVNDIVNLNKRQIYLKLMIDGVASNAFSAMTMDTIAKPEISYRAEVLAASRAKYAKPRATVEQQVADWAGRPSADVERRVEPDSSLVPVSSSRAAIVRPAPEVDRHSADVATPLLRLNRDSSLHAQHNSNFGSGKLGTGKAEVGNNSNLLSPDIALPSFSTREGGLPENRDTPEGAGSQRKGNIGTGTPKPQPKLDELRQLLGEITKDKK